MAKDPVVFGSWVLAPDKGVVHGSEFLRRFPLAIRTGNYILTRGDRKGMSLPPPCIPASEPSRSRRP
ncbi:hypothetical protein VTG60DRAFT_4076 [Thermothelomyces hinnuleus]